MNQRNSLISLLADVTYRCYSYIIILNLEKRNGSPPFFIASVKFYSAHKNFIYI